MQSKDIIPSGLGCFISVLLVPFTSQKGNCICPSSFPSALLHQLNRKRLSLFSLLAWGHKNKSFPPLALGPKADCQWWQPKVGKTPWCVWFNGACEVHKVWSTTGNHQHPLPTYTSTVSDFGVPGILFSACTLHYKISNSLPLLSWKMYSARKFLFKISKFPLQSSITGPATSRDFQNTAVYCT